MTRLRIAHVGIVLAAIVLASAPAWTSEIGYEVVAQVREATYSYYLDARLFTRFGDDRGGLWGLDHDAARDNIVAIFESFGLDVELHAFDYWGETAYNVVATQWGTTSPDAQYIVGAHYDSVYNPGADDDASGVAALLEIARVLSSYETEYTIKYIAFDLEEFGLIGSEAYVVDHLSDDIRGMVQLDMISWNNGTLKCQIRGQTASNPIKNALADAFAEYATGVTALVKPPAAGYGSDHMPFEDAGFQACWLVEHGFRYNPHFHSARDSIDVPEYIDYWYGAELLRGVAGFLADQALANYPYDCDGDGVVDAAQIQNDPGLDCNGNQILDECEFAGDRDMNGNGVPDLCDIYAGTSGDCNGNWVPDEIEAGYTDDCNGNGFPDLCDVAEHISEDINQNGVPDECEVEQTIYVDDDAPNDPGPGNPWLSDPDEDGSPGHPFDSIAEAIAQAVHASQITVLSGTYSGIGNRWIDFIGRRAVLRSEAGPETCVIDLEGWAAGLLLQGEQGPETVIDGFTITNGSWYWGTALDLFNASPTVANCVFSQNTVESWGGGGAVRGYESDARFVNCAFRGNVVNVSDPSDLGAGGAAYFVGGSPSFVQCSFSANSAARSGGAIALEDAVCTLANSILWDNAAPSGPQIALYRLAILQTSHSDVAGGAAAVYVSGATLIWGPGNIDADPLFVDPESGDLRLLPGSSCIDAGANALVPADFADLDRDGDVRELTPLDLDYEGRFFDDPDTPDTGCGSAPVVDMGAYEFGGTGPVPCVGDLNGDGMVSLFDLAVLLSGFGIDDRGDLDCDGDTDHGDLTALLNSYGDVCPQTGRGGAETRGEG
ncbi:MAG: M28 family peptidase [Phycisphaerae bacterium]